VKRASIFVVILSSLLAVAADKPTEYPLLLNILSSEGSVETYTSQQPLDTSCTTDAFGHTDCTTVGGTKRGRVVRQVQNAEGLDGNLYTIQWFSRRRAFGNGAAASAGSTQNEGAFVPRESTKHG
jgi:hypothetical protein